MLHECWYVACSMLQKNLWVRLTQTYHLCFPRVLLPIQSWSFGVRPLRASSHTCDTLGSLHNFLLTAKSCLFFFSCLVIPSSPFHCSLSLAGAQFHFIPLGCSSMREVNAAWKLFLRYYNARLILSNSEHSTCFPRWCNNFHLCFGLKKKKKKEYWKCLLQTIAGQKHSTDNVVWF